MTLTVEVPALGEPWVGDVHGAPFNGEVVDSGARIQAASGAGYPGPCIDSARLGVLLEDAAFAEWATETAARYRVSALDALGALAEALFRDGQSRAAGSAVSTDLLVQV